METMTEPDPMHDHPSPHHHPSLRERVVLITGGGRGIGREMALSLVRAGARVTITGGKAVDELRAVEAEARELAGEGRLLGIQADVTRWEDCRRAVKDTIKAFGGLHVLCNNAGVGMLLISPNFVRDPFPFWKADVDAWRKIIDVNINGAFMMARAAVPGMVEQGFGKVVNISTSLITMVKEGYSPYGPSKAALEAATGVWVRDLEGTGVTVNVLAPGGRTDTAFVPPDSPGPDGGEMLRPEIMAPPMLWLASDASNDFTGHRYIAKDWDPALPPDEAAALARGKSHETPNIL